MANYRSMEERLHLCKQSEERCHVTLADHELESSHAALAAKETVRQSADRNSHKYCSIVHDIWLCATSTELAI
jgi:hypothetical protein